MAIDFPASPSVNDTYTVGSTTWTWDGTKWTITSGGAAGATDKIEEGNTSAEVIDTGSDGRFVVTTEGAERARVDSSGRLLVGTPSAYVSYGGSQDNKLQIAGTVYSNAAMSAFVFANTPYGGYINLGLSRNSTVGSHTVVQNGDGLGAITFNGSDGTTFKAAADIGCFVDGTPGANDMPGRLVFSTTADGASSPTERYRITSSGFHRFNTGNAEASSSNFGASIRGDGGIWAYRNVSTFAASQFGGTAGYAQVVGNGNLENTNNSYGAISDVKLKENIVDAGSQWSDLKNVRVRKYNFKLDTGYLTHTQIGLIAQEVEEVSPGLVRDSVDEETGEVTKTVNYSVLYMKAVKALQEAMERIETLEAQNASLEARLTALEGGTP